jgi:hypothetical protein
LYLVDTNVVSEARHGSRRPVGWLRSFRPDAVYLGAPTFEDSRVSRINPSNID